MSQPVGPSMPTIGRIVHVYLPPITVPAIVTAVSSSDGMIMCTAFIPGGAPRSLVEVEHDESGNIPGTWRWPKVTR